MKHLTANKKENKVLHSHIVYVSMVNELKAEMREKTLTEINGTYRSSTFFRN